MQFEAPSGYPLGTNKTFKYAAAILIPLLKLLTKRDWRGAENLPKSGPVIVISNHVSYADALVFAHYLYGNGRAVRYLGKDSVFRIPILGKIILSSGQFIGPIFEEGSSLEANQNYLSGWCAARFQQVGGQRGRSECTHRSHRVCNGGNYQIVRRN